MVVGFEFYLPGSLVIAAWSKLSGCSSDSYWCSSYVLKIGPTCRITTPSLWSVRWPRGSGRPGRARWRKCWPLRLEGLPDGMLHCPLQYWRVPFPGFQDKADKNCDLMGVRPIITALAAMALSGGLSVALNALESILTAGRGGASHTRGSAVRSTLIPQSRDVWSRGLGVHLSYFPLMSVTSIGMLQAFLVCRVKVTISTWLVRRRGLFLSWPWMAVCRAFYPCQSRWDLCFFLGCLLGYPLIDILDTVQYYNK